MPTDFIGLFSLLIAARVRFVVGRAQGGLGAHAQGQPFSMTSRVSSTATVHSAVMSSSLRW